MWWQVDIFVVSNLSELVEEDQLVAHFVCPLSHRSCPV